MKKIIPFFIIGAMVLSTFAVGAITPQLQIETQPPIIAEPSSASDRAYTHTVLIEVGTSTTCPACPSSNTAWHNLYNSGSYDFEYCEMVVNKNSQASSHLGARKLYWVPTSYFDGGENVYPGTNTGSFQSYLDISGSREVPALETTLSTEWITSDELEITYEVTSNETEEYSGRLRVYIVELESSYYNDYNGNPYYHAFLDFAVNKQITIAGEGSIADTIIWDKTTNGFSNLRIDNVQVILAVFTDTAEQSYSDPDDANNDGDRRPFSAYYVDETQASLPAYDNDAPAAPHIDGEAEGKVGNEFKYSICGSDPNDDALLYIINWGDGTEETIGPYPSGVCSTAKHTWEEKGDYTIRVKAQDPYGAESDWATLEVSMPLRLNPSLVGWFQHFLDQHPRLSSLLQQILSYSK